nr:kielin/chordin-like protein isoform X1 [Helicoverpa armigera]
MLSVLRLFILATVGEVLSSEAGTLEFFTHDHDLFTGHLRSFANNYHRHLREADTITLAEAKITLRLLQVYEYTTNSSGFDEIKGQSFPLTEAAKFCTMGAKTKVGCNYCTCVAGQMYICTGTICPSKSEDRRPCENGEKRQIDSCNYCLCRNGVEICTKKNCQKAYRSAVVRSHDTDNCKNGQSKREDCNDCSCKGGNWVCTLKLCKKEKEETEAVQCKDGQTKKIDCNRCGCIDGRWFCTLMKCRKNIKNTKKLNAVQCKDGQTKKVDCNRCGCINGGWLCNLIKCGKNLSNKKEINTAQCKDGQTKKINCNRCSCINGGWLCTLMKCGKNGKNIKKLNAVQCKDGQTRKVNCNRCGCINGRWFCTLIKCKKNIKNKNKKYKNMNSVECRAGQSKKEDCNSCHCIKGTWACTLIHCSTKPHRQTSSPDKGKCSKDETLQIKCMKCTCIRNQWHCSTNRCRKPSKKSPKVRSQEGMNECIEWRRKTVDCNRCLCYKGEWFCTKNPCNRGLFPTPPKLPALPQGSCTPGALMELNCVLCKCARNRWRCSNVDCEKKNLDKRVCKEGTSWMKDACNRCYCHNEREYCELKNCYERNSLRRTKMCSGFDRNYQECKQCKCVSNYWICRGKWCPELVELGPMIDHGLITNYSPEILLYLKLCKEGQKTKLDRCTDCLCYADEKWRCLITCDISQTTTTKPNYDKLSEENVEEWGTVPSDDLGLKRNDDYNITFHLVPDELCTSGSMSIRQCNQCYCYQGILYCRTTNKCKPNDGRDKEDIKDTGHCNFGLTFRVGPCVRCNCDSGVYNCDERIKCVDFHFNPEGETPCPMRGRRFTKGPCNFCVCYSKSHFLCSDLPCPHSGSEELPAYLRGPRESVAKSQQEGNWFATSGQKIRNKRATDSLRRTKMCTGFDLNYDHPCKLCKCVSNYWLCSGRWCSELHDVHKFPEVSDKETMLYLELCIEGQRTKLDRCTDCLCYADRRWRCLITCDIIQSKPDYTPTTHPTELYEEYGQYDYQLPTTHPTELYKEHGQYDYQLPTTHPTELYEEYGQYVTTEGSYIKLFFLDMNDDFNVTFHLSAELYGEKCKPGSMSIRKCNQCYCYEENWYCKTTDCKGDSPKTIKDIKETGNCVFGKVFRVGPCTRCICEPNGYNCTDKIECISFEDDLGQTSCTPGKSFKRDPSCDRIFCTCYSKGFVCSDNQCSPEMRNFRRLRTSDSSSSELEDKCRLGDTYRQDACNYCYCDKNRERVCTNHKCPYPKSTQSQYTPSIVEEKCTIGVRFRKDKCNYCYCNYELKLICSRNTCYRTRGLLRNSLPTVCTVGLKYDIDYCNQCQCTSTKRWKCTQNICPSIYDHLLLRSERKSCIDGSKRNKDCNHCICHKGIELCTQIRCWHDNPSRSYIHLMEPECEHGESIPAPDACNMCICMNNDILCTEYPCLERKVTGRSGKCTEGDRYYLEDRCNFCVCQEGQEFCTARACLVDDTSPKDKCKEGEMTKSSDGCNMCVCTEGILSCTDFKCPKSRLRKDPLDTGESKPFSYLKSKEKAKCVEGKMYVNEEDDPYCPDTCFCDNGELLCTNRKCDWGHGKAQFQEPPPKSSLSPNNLTRDFVSCVDYEEMPADDACSVCMCLNNRRVCTKVHCTESEPKVVSSRLADVDNQANQNRNAKNKEIFCEPFTFFSPDNNRYCRNCFCLHNGLALCLLNLCKYSKEVEHKSRLFESGCIPGETVNPNKCLTCTCSDQNKWVCYGKALRECQERDCDAKDEFHMGFKPYCAECQCSLKEWFCSIKPKTCKGNAKCPMGTLIQNPNQHCSVCLCGGTEPGSQNMCFTEVKCVKQVINQLIN